MRRELMDILVDPIGKGDLKLMVREEDGAGNVVSGELRGAGGRSYPIQRGIPRFVPSDLKDLAQTSRSFGFKWQQRAAYEHPRVNELNLKNEMDRFGAKTADDFRRIFQREGWVVDVGCGAGHYASLYVTAEGPGRWVGTDLSSGIDIARNRLGAIKGTHFVQGNLFELPYRPESIDLLVCRGVMHHTPSTEQAFMALAPLVRRGGEFIFLVYQKNGPIREFTDDHVRHVLSAMAPQDAWEALKSLTRLGKALAGCDVEIEVEEDIPYLGIRAGRYDLHMFVYNNFLKTFYRKDWTMDESNLISFDWYHPKYAFRHSIEEIANWCKAAGFDIAHVDSRWTGHTVRAVKRV